VELLIDWVLMTDGEAEIRCAIPTSDSRTTWSTSTPRSASSSSTSR
jgi:hypothetical protein